MEPNINNRTVTNISENEFHNNENDSYSEPSFKENLAKKVYEYVIDALYKGIFSPEQKITQRRVAKELGMSTIPVREGFEILLQHGWVERIPNKGIRVRKFTIEDLVKLYELREILEVGAVRILCQRITPEQLLQLNTVVNSLEAACEDRDVRGYQKFDVEFHRTLLRLTGNERMEKFHESVLMQSMLFIEIGAYKTAFQWIDSLEILESVSHKHICEAIGAKDMELAEELIRTHIDMGFDLAKMAVKYAEISNLQIKPRKKKKKHNRSTKV